MSFKIAIDATSLKPAGKGVSRYLHNLLVALARLDHLTQYHVFVDRRFATSRLPQQDNFHYRPVPFRRNLYWKLVQFPSILRSEQFDLVHLPAESSCFKTPTPCVVTVHEIAQTSWRLRRTHGPGQWLAYMLSEGIFRRTIPKARAIIADSAATKDDLLRLYPVETQRVTVIHLAPDCIFLEHRSKVECEKVRETLGAKEGYILSFATGDSRENVNIVLESYARICARLRQKLVLCGTKAHVREEVREKCRRHGIEERVVLLDYVSDDELRGLYAGADLYVDISYYEGFGLQPCEAMASGAPVVASNIPVFIEVLGSAAKLVPVEGAGALATAMTEILENQLVWQERSRLSLERATKFSWERVARQTLAIYESVVNNNGAPTPPDPSITADVGGRLAVP